MGEKEKPDLKIITYGEKISPISIRSWNDQTQLFLHILNE